ncbi:MAG: redoxin domain-containing protein [Bacteroidia bacterium]
MMKFITLLFISTALFACSIGAQDKEGYTIDVKVKGLKDSIAYLAYYYGDKKYAQDTARIDGKGQFVFQGKENLPGGIYMIILPGQQYFEIVPENPDIKIETTLENLISDLKVTGSPETALFYEYLQFVDKQAGKIQDLTARKETASEEEKARISTQVKELENSIIDYKKDVISEYPEAFVTKVFKAMREPEIPEPPKDAEGKIDSTWEYYYFKAHYFDNFDFTDDGLVRTPVYQPRMEKYVTKIVMQHPDSIIQALDFILQNTRNSPEQFKFNLFWFTNYYERSKLMIAENVFSHLAVNYWCNEAYDKSWMDTVTIVKICEKGKMLNPTLIGKKAPELNLEDTLRKRHSMHRLDAKYTILFFWDSTCGHCKKQIPKLIELHDKYKADGVEVYAVNTEWESHGFKKYLREKEGMREFINVQDTTNASRFRQKYDVSSTPVIMVVDEKKEIIAKRVDIEVIGEILENRKKNRSELSRP